MRRRVVRVVIVAVTMAILLVGVPLSTYVIGQQANAAQASLDARAGTLARSVERRLLTNERVDETMLTPWIDGIVNPEAQILVVLPDTTRLRVGDIGQSRVLVSRPQTASGATVVMEVRAADALAGTYTLIALVTGASLVAFFVGVVFAFRMSRRINAPLIYLAAAAEQLGSGQTRPRVKPSGIEEIDLVQAELVRTADRMAGRLAAERQFAADATHQLRTPLTALTMRLEEIELLATDDEIKQEVSAALAQTERLAGVVDDLLVHSRRASGGTTEAVSLDDIFSQQDEEWAATFKSSGRSITFENESGRAVLASPGALSQVLATLIENSLKYGAGVTLVSTRQASGKGVFIDVADEGEGVPEELAHHIFDRGVSGGGSTGVGLALAKDLVSADGGRLELTQRVPATFTVFLNGLPSTLDPKNVLPRGALVSVGRRRDRR